tara:strand:+ start:711 stop:908 length:198 start_codon:yes stop_codon:yes gene_type:complete
MNLQETYLNKFIIFDYETGCIPAGSICYCYRIDEDSYWVYFKQPILGRSDIKLHSKVIVEHGRTV